MDIDLTTIIACREATGVDLDAIKRALSKLVPDALLANTLGDVPSGTGAMVSLNGCQMGILCFSSCLEVEALDYGPSPNFFWMSAKEDLAPHKAHIRVMVTGEVKTRDDLIAAARALTLLSAAICQVVPAMGVLWCAADHLLQPDRFMRIATTPATAGGTYAPLWVRMLATQTPEGLVVATHGLSHYAGRELEFGPTLKIDFGILGARAMQIAHVLIESGSELSEGDVVAPEKFKVTKGSSRFFSNAPVYFLAAQ